MKRPSVPQCLALACLLASIGCGSGAAPDSGSQDAAQSSVDAFEPPTAEASTLDAEAPPEDSTAPPHDGASPTDATVPPEDGGADGAGDAPPPDAGTDAACGAAGSFGTGHGEAFSYGRHYPNGTAAVDYIYGARGMWGALDGLTYADNYYAACATADHPENLSALIAAASGPPYTARDANCHLLWVDSPASSDPQLAVPDGGAGFAFREHDGVGANGAQSGTPFTVYWFDDNSLAINMSRAYALPTASGLATFPDFTRWSVVSGDSASWHGTPYGTTGNPTSDCCMDTMALNGLYDLANGDFASASKEWGLLLSASGAAYDATTQRYLYPSAHSNYHLGLFKILNDQMMGDPAAATNASPTVATLLQHSMSLGSNILDTQQHDGDGGALIGWVTDIPAGGSLINTETVASQVLALGARANAVFEPGVAPLSNDPKGYFLRSYHVLSAVGSAGSQPGYMTSGPGFYAPPGTYTVDFRLRAPAPTGTVATVSISDTVSGGVLATHDVDASEMAGGNGWTEITLSAAVPAGCNQLSLRTYWTGTANLDVGPVRVR